MIKEKSKGTSILARRRLRQNSSKYNGDDHMQFNGKSLKPANRTEVYYENHRDDLKKNR